MKLLEETLERTVALNAILRGQHENSIFLVFIGFERERERYIYIYIHT